MGTLGILQGEINCSLMDDGELIVMDKLHGYKIKSTHSCEHPLGSKKFVNLEEDIEMMEASHLFPSLESTFSSLRKCRERKSLFYATHLYASICGHGLQNILSLENFLVSLFVDCGSLLDAQKVFDRLIHRNEYSWTSLIQGYIDQGAWEYGLSLLPKMLDDGSQPSKHTFIVLLKACARMKNLEQGQALHYEIVKEGFEDDLFVGSTLVDMYVRCSLLPEAQEVFNSMTIRDIALWNALIKGYEESGLCWEALDCLVEMQAGGISPDAFTYVSTLKACGSIGAIQRGKELHNELQSAGFQRNLFVGSALVDMYARCGLLSLAEDVFNKLQVKDVAVWNTLIAGYAEHAHVDKVLICFEQMQLQGVLPTPATFVCVIKACISGSLFDGSLDVHTSIVKRGFEADLSLGTSLVGMYVKCGLLVDAFGVLSRLCSRDIVLYNTLIVGYSEQGLVEEALRLVKQMQSEGIFPDAITFSCILKAYASSGALVKGQMLHIKIVKLGYDLDCIIGNTIVSLYGKLGFLIEAEEVFGAMVLRDVVSWNALMAGYLENELDEEVLNCLEQLRLNGLVPDLTTLICTLKACCKTGAIDIGREIHAEIVQESCETDVLAGTALVGMYAGGGSFLEAEEVFKELPVQDAVLWTTLIVAYAEQGLCKQALNCFQQMQEKGISPMEATFLGALKACGSVTAIDQSQEIHMEVAKLGLEDNTLVCNALVYVYAKHGFFAEACEVFNSLQERDVISWNSIMTGYADQGLVDNILGCFESMQLEAIAPDAGTYICSLKAFIRPGATDKGMEMHSRVVEDGYENDSNVRNSLVSMYASWGCLVEAQEVFDEVRSQSVSSWNALLSGYVECGLHEEALKLLEQLQEELMAVDAITYVSGLKACGCVGAINKGQELHAEIIKRGYDRQRLARSHPMDGHGDGSPEAVNLEVAEATNTILGTALIDMYCRCGMMLDARQTFSAASTKDLITWNSFLAGHARQGETESVFRLLDMMVKEGIQPDRFTFLCTLIVCSHAGLPGRGLKYFESMSKEYGISATSEHLNCMMDILGRAGRLEEAVTMLLKMPLYPNFVTWNTLLGACYKWNSADLGIHALECMDETIEGFSTAFTLMSNIYTGAFT